MLDLDVFSKFEGAIGSRTEKVEWILNSISKLTSRTNATSNKV